MNLQQINWLVDSMKEEHEKCRWKIVLGHYPLISAGFYKDCTTLEEYRAKLIPIFASFNVNMYISGHDHTSQILRLDELPECTLLIVGAVGEMRPKDPFDFNHPNLIWGDNVSVPVVVDLVIKKDEIRYEFHAVKSKPDEYGSYYSVIQSGVVVN